jgi:hypothetical protein
MNNEIINDDTPIFGKYKTVSEIKKLPIISAIQVISKMKVSEVKEYLVKWIFESHYSKLPLYGSLTQRIKKLNNKICYNYIISNCFDEIDPLNFCTSNTILNDKCLNIIKSLHEIEPSANGTFMDYLIRRIICEINQEIFEDDRVKSQTNLHNFSINYEFKKFVGGVQKNLSAYIIFCKDIRDSVKTDLNNKQIMSEMANKWKNIDADTKKKYEQLASEDKKRYLREQEGVQEKQLWQFIAGDGIGRWIISDEPDIKSNVKSYLENKERFIELERKNEWLKIKYRSGWTGWVRYLVPDVENTLGVSGNINDYVPNKWFKQIDNGDDNHYCESGCKTEIMNFSTGDNFIFPYCQNMCYAKAQDTKNYKTKDILKEIYIVSCCHRQAIEAYYDVPNQDKFNLMMNKIDELCIPEFIEQLFILCKSLLTNYKTVFLNPSLGSKNLINGDCDIVIDDNLIDIKCTNGNKDILEILQLLGYSSLLKNNEKYNIRINNISILNLLKGEYTVYNIKNISDNNLLKYLHLLMNKCNNTTSAKRNKKNKITEFKYLSDPVSHSEPVKPVHPEYPIGRINANTGTITNVASTNNNSNSIIERCFPQKKDIENEHFDDYKKWKNGINYITNRKIKIGGKTHTRLKEKIIKDLTKYPALMDEYVYNEIVDDIIEKIKKLKKWTDFIEFEGKKYGIPAHLYKNYINKKIDF